MDIILAAQLGNTSDVKKGIEQGENVNALDYDNRSALMYAAKNGYVAIVSLLLEAGANVHARSRYLKTPLIYAASGGSFEVVKQIIAAGADINAIDDEGWSPLIHVAHRGNWNLDVAAYLLKIGANPNQITKNDRVSAIRRALENRDEKMAIMLMEYPIDINHMFYVSERLLVEVLANPSYAPFINKHLNDLNEENVLKWKKCRVRALYK